jgi:hypothetical protein
MGAAPLGWETGRWRWGWKEGSLNLKHKYEFITTIVLYMAPEV